MELIPESAKILVPPSSKDDKSSPSEEPLLGRVIAELDKTLTAALVGLAFPTARDTALSALAALRKSITIHEQSGEHENVELCSKLMVKVTEELRVRYESERRIRDTALFDAYEEDRSNNSTKETAEEVSVIERLLLGADAVGDNNIEEISFNAAETRKNPLSDDFVRFHQSFADAATSKLGYNALQGLGASLEEWKISTDSSAELEKSYAKAITALAPFLDAWDETDERDIAESGLISEFESKAQLDGDPGNGPVEGLQILGSGTAADAMSTFFEFAAVEKTRLKEILLRFLPSHRFSRMAFAERFCWARLMELSPSASQFSWERGVSDGNRDIRSHLATLPCSPQFRRYLPKYLDHSPEGLGSPEEAQAPASIFESPCRGSIAAVEMGALTKTLLETGNLEIVDITKKEFAEEELPDPFEASGTDFNGDDESESELYVATNDEGDNEEPNSKDAESLSDGLDAADAVSTDETEQASDFPSMRGGKLQHGITISSFSTPPDNSSSSLGLLYSAASSMIEQHVERCLHVRAEGNRECTMLLTTSHLILEYDGNLDGFFEGELLAMQEEADRQKRMADDIVACSREKDEDAVNQQNDDRRYRENAALRPKSIRFNLSEVSHIYLRR